MLCGVAWCCVVLCGEALEDCGCGTNERRKEGRSGHHGSLVVGRCLWISWCSIVVDAEVVAFLVVDVTCPLCSLDCRLELLNHSLTLLTITTTNTGYYTRRTPQASRDGWPSR